MSLKRSRKLKKKHKRAMEVLDLNGKIILLNVDKNLKVIHFQELIFPFFKRICSHLKMLTIQRSISTNYYKLTHYQVLR